MTEPDAFMLKTRLDNLRRNLEDVEHVVKSVGEQRSVFHGLLPLPRTVRGALAEVGSRVDLILGALRREDMTTAEQEIERLGARVTELTVRMGEQAAADEVLSEVERRFNIVQLSDKEELGSVLVDAAKDQKEKLAEVEKRVRSAEEKAAQGKGEEANQLLDEAWNTYATQLSASTDRLFSEYVDFLGGLALRDSGFDRGICSIADELIRQAPKIGGGWSSLTIPAHHEALNMTLARIIRLGFPEWTVWTLPLTAHELGHVLVAETGDAFADVEDDRTAQVCLADAYGTLVMGPAYACAAMLIRLNPLTAFHPEDDRLTAKRAETVLRTLDHMNAWDEVDPPYAQVRQGLEAAWAEGTGHAEPSGELGAEELETLEAWIERMSGWLGSYRALPGEHWPRIKRWAQALGTEKQDEIELQNDDEHRFVLNAAWQARLDHPEQTEHIARDALALWRRLDEHLRKETGGGKGQAQAGSFPHSGQHTT
ncbi:MAG TPA: hypothetical protein VF058_12050 [Actinomycetota bacterium]